MNTKNISVVIPTKNERDNVEYILSELNKISEVTEIIFVDDSTDDTYQYLSDKQITLIRGDNVGLAKAIEKGVTNATNEYVCVMDADGSHPSSIIPLMISKIKENTIVVAKRKTTEYGLKRRCITFCSTLIACPLVTVKEPLSGFFMISKKNSNHITITSKGYKYLLEFLVKSNNVKVIEVEYHFQKRRNGKSKANSKIFFLYLIDLMFLYFYKIRKVICC
jgi:dolichol-phosphate mannosyltransferase